MKTFIVNNVLLFIKNFKQITKGLWNVIIFKTLSKEKKEVIKKRRDLCSSCALMSTNYTKLGLYTSDRLDEHCGVCKCNIKLKTACLSCNCGLEEFNKKNPAFPPLKLKWEKI